MYVSLCAVTVVVRYNKIYDNKCALYRIGLHMWYTLEMSLALTPQSCRRLLVCSSRHIAMTKACLCTDTAATSLAEPPMAPSSHESPSFLYDPVSQYVS